jgi:hypothetical protein
LLLLLLLPVFPNPLRTTPVRGVPMLRVGTPARGSFA